MNQLKPAVMMLVWLSLITGVAYPLLVTGIAQLIFPAQANGSLVVRDGKPVGSSLIGQPFDAPKYFWGRPVRHGAPRLQRRRVRRLQPGPPESDSRTPRPGPGSTLCARPTPANGARARGPRDGVGQRPRSPHQPGGGALPGPPGGQGARGGPGRGAAPGGAAHRGPSARDARRASRQRASAQPRPRRRGPG